MYRRRTIMFLASRRRNNAWVEGNCVENLEIDTDLEGKHEASFGHKGDGRGTIYMYPSSIGLLVPR